jgi:hypothetical protein
MELILNRNSGGRDAATLQKQKVVGVATIIYGG